MADTLVDRLLAAENPHVYLHWDDTDSYYLAKCGVSSQDIPQLIELAKQWPLDGWERSYPQHNLDLDDDKVALLPVTAWRALADLKAEIAVEPLLEILRESDDESDDWIYELPTVFGKIGASAIEPLFSFANDLSVVVGLRSIAVDGLVEIVKHHPETRAQVTLGLTKLMAEATEEDIAFNSCLMNDLVEFQVVEAAEAIERAFANNLLDISMRGPWEEVRQDLGVEGLGLPMPENPYNSTEEFLRGEERGIFSASPVFCEGEIDYEAAEAYYERARQQFHASPEGEKSFELYGDVGWYQMLLDFGLQYLGEIVDEMTLASVEEFVLEHIPRKVSTEPETAPEIIGELAFFWEFLDRVHSLPHAKRIAAWLREDGTERKLTRELADPRNYGMAKSIFMAGSEAGYDMTTEAGMAEYMLAYNAALSQTAPPAHEYESAPPLTPQLDRGHEVGRNDPCPCGSGKKYKKCCRN